MNKRKRWMLLLGWLGLFGVLSPLKVEGQLTSGHLTLGAAPSPDTKLVAFDGNAFPAFNEVFRLIPETENLKAASFVLVNQSGRPIIGVAFTLTLIDQAGESSSRDMASHSFMLAGFQPLAQPGESLLMIPPLTFVPESSLRSKGKVIVHPSSRLLDLVVNAKEIHVDLDCLIFGDGEIVGPDRIGLPREIQARKTAADSVVRRVYASTLPALQLSAEENAQALSNQFPVAKITNFLNGISGRLSRQNPIAINLSQVKPPRPRDFVGKHDFLFSRQLLETGNFKASFEYIKSIPEPPIFYRKNGQTP